MQCLGSSIIQSSTKTKRRAKAAKPQNATNRSFGVLADSDISSVINNHVSFIPCMNRPLTDDGYEVKFGFVSTTYQLNGFHFRKSSPFNSYSGISLTSLLFDVALLWKIGENSWDFEC